MSTEDAWDVLQSAGRTHANTTNGTAKGMNERTLSRTLQPGSGDDISPRAKNTHTHAVTEAESP